MSQKEASTTNTSVHLHPEFKIGTIDKRLYGSFLEHMGRAVYTGAYEPGHPEADANGWRLDVVEAVKDLGVTTVRYPGGNFVSSYRWEDGIGPKENRPRRIDLAWKSIETNQVGTDDFMQWSKLTHTDPMMCVNLGTRGIEDAMNLLEYCNHPSGTYYSDLRRKYGTQDPYNIKLWCLGNEVDGPWQMGAKTAREYGAIARETAKAMRNIDESIEFVACGSSAPFLPTHPKWEADLLDEAYDFVDYVSIHIYYEDRDRDTQAFLAQSQDFKHYIQNTLAAIDFVKSKKRSKKTVQLSVDEWNVWNDKSDLKDKSKQGIEAPALLEETYSHVDALLVGSLFITLLNHCDRVKIACLAQLVNVIAPIHTIAGGALVKQSIYYPFSDVTKNALPTVLRAAVNCDTYEDKDYGDIPMIDLAATCNESESELCLFAVNKSLETPRELKLHAIFPGKIESIKHLCRTDTSDVKANSSASYSSCAADSAPVLPPLSWNVIKLSFA